jgi:DNA-directed RNA polymerase specialized sigma24 family protein
VASADLPAKEALELLPLNDALEKLAAVDPELAELVDLRYFAGLPNEEIARLRGLSLATVERRFAVARSFLHRLLKGTDADRAS